MRARSAVIRAAQVLILVTVLALTVGSLRTQWSSLGDAARSIHMRALPLAASCAAVLALYAVQIHAWRILASAWGARLPFWTAARVWSVSNLARFVPIPVVATTGAIGLLGRRAGVPAAAAAGAALLATLLNVAAGFVVIVAFASPLLPSLTTHIVPAVIPMIGALAFATLVALPLLVRPAARTAASILGRPSVQLPPMSARVLVTAVTANLVAWLLYGLAFWWLALTLFPSAPGSWLTYTAVFAGGYLAGWLALVLPAGLGVREAVLGVGLVQLGLLNVADATLLALASRLILTVLEVLPGAAFLASGALQRTPSPSDASS